VAISVTVGPHGLLHVWPKRSNCRPRPRSSLS